MAMQELAIFRGADLSEEEARNLSEISHATLLAEVFDALVTELDNNGNTDRFAELRADYARKLIAYWKNKIAIYRQALSEGIMSAGSAFVQGEESLTVSQLGVYESDDEVVLMINRKTPTEEDEVRISANIRGEIDESLRPPTTQSKIKTDPDETYDIVYKVTFGTNRFVPGSVFTISLFEREKVYEDPEHQRPWIYSTRTIHGSPLDLSASI